MIIGRGTSVILTPATGRGAQLEGCWHGRGTLGEGVVHRCTSKSHARDRDRDRDRDREKKKSHDFDNAAEGDGSAIHRLVAGSGDGWQGLNTT